jgi:hypothetical protein
MSTDNPIALFNVIEIEYSPNFSPYYKCAKNIWDGKWYVEEKGSRSIEELAHDIAYDLAGKHTQYEIISKLSVPEIKSRYFNNEGRRLHDNSESSTQLVNVRELDRKERSRLGKMLIIEIQKRKEFLDSLDIMFINKK